MRLVSGSISTDPDPFLRVRTSTDAQLYGLCPKLLIAQTRNLQENILNATAQESIMIENYK